MPRKFSYERIPVGSLGSDIIKMVANDELTPEEASSLVSHHGPLYLIVSLTPTIARKIIPRTRTKRELISEAIKGHWADPNSAYHTRYDDTPKGRKTIRALSAGMKNWWNGLGEEERQDFVKTRGKRISEGMRSNNK